MSSTFQISIPILIHQVSAKEKKERKKEEKYSRQPSCFCLSTQLRELSKLIGAFSTPYHTSTRPHDQQSTNSSQLGPLIRTVLNCKEKREERREKREERREEKRRERNPYVSLLFS
jgi:hypothetical protein